MIRSKPFTQNVDDPKIDFASLDGWKIAELLGCHYMGDMNVVDHDGYFYEVNNWKEYDYASCVEFCNLPDDCDGGGLLISCGTINKPDDISSAFDCCDVQGEDRENVHAQIEACKGYAGIETSYSQKFRRISWEHVCYLHDGLEFIDSEGKYLTENGVWESVKGWIENLKSE